MMSCDLTPIELADWLHVAGAVGIGKVRQNYDAIERVLLAVADMERERDQLRADLADAQQFATGRAGGYPAIRNLLLYEFGTTDPGLLRYEIQNLKERSKS